VPLKLRNMKVKMKNRKFTKKIKGLVKLLSKERYSPEDIAHYLVIDEKKVKEFLQNDH
jgi:hypothetical protein